MKVLSLYDGISCGRIALERAGIKVDKYIAYEIDKFAIAISKYHYPDIEHKGNIFQADFHQYKDFDMVIGGSPCTFWSICNKNREIDKNGEGWKLFMKFKEALDIIKPKYYLYENVNSMPKTIKEYISQEFRQAPIMINSSLLSAQQRRRLYWTNIKEIQQPLDKGIYVKDILDRKVESEFNLPKEKYKILNASSKKKEALFLCKEMGASLRTREDEQGRCKRLKVRKDNKINTLTTVYTDSMICKPIFLGTVGEKRRQGNCIYSVRGKTIAFTANKATNSYGYYKIDLPDGDYLLRKLTHNEAERGQTLPDDYTKYGINQKEEKIEISSTRRYMLIGNGWTVDVISHILSYIDEEDKR